MNAIKTIKLNADIVVVSIHKSLEQMIMKTYLHVKVTAIKCSEIKQNWKITWQLYKNSNRKSTDLFIFVFSQIILFKKEKKIYTIINSKDRHIILTFFSLINFLLTFHLFSTIFLFFLFLPMIFNQLFYRFY